jgi:hypothetical protein
MPKIRFMAYLLRFNGTYRSVPLGKRPLYLAGVYGLIYLIYRYLLALGGN